MIASSTCAVQTLLVAFSRRMCCSRVCSARRSAGLALRIDRHADEPARHLPLELVAYGEIRRVRTAEAERHAEALRVADRDVCAPLARRRQQRQARADRPRPPHGRLPRGWLQRARDSRAHGRSTPGYCSSTPNAFDAAAASAVADHHLDAERSRAGAHHLDRLRQHVVGDKEHVRLRSCPTRCTSVIASAAAVASSSSEALAIASPVRSVTIVWKFSSASRRPCEISG